MLEGQRHARAGRHVEALAVWDDLLAVQPATFALIAEDYAASALACGDQTAALSRLQAVYERQPSLDLLTALLRLTASADERQSLLQTHLQAHPTLSAAAVLLKEQLARHEALPTADAKQLQGLVAAAAKPGQRYRCAACGFEAQHYFWQCPGCQTWDSYPTRRQEDQ